MRAAQVEPVENSADYVVVEKKINRDD